MAKSRQRPPAAQPLGLQRNAPPVQQRRVMPRRWFALRNLVASAVVCAAAFLAAATSFQALKSPSTAASSMGRCGPASRERCSEVEVAAATEAAKHGEAGTEAVRRATTPEAVSAALAMLERALQLDDQTGFAARYATNAGLALRRLHRYDEAQERLKLAVRLDPDFFYARYGLGNGESNLLYNCVHACKAHWSEAEEHLSAAVQLAPSPGLKASAATNLAQLLRRAHHEVFARGGEVAPRLAGRDLLHEARMLLEAVVETSRAQATAGGELPSLSRPTVTTLSALLQQSGRESQRRELHVWAVRLGLWRDVWQRPDDFDPRLPSRGPWWDALHRLPPLRPLAERWRGLREEALSLVSAGLLTPVGERVSIDLLLYNQSRGERWGEFALIYNGEVLEGAPARAPLLWELLGEHLDSVSKHGQAVFSVLQPGGRISPHCGSTNHLLTCHLGLSVPTAEPGAMGIRVGGEERVWAEGAWLCFEDSYEHEVWNLSDEPRVVLLINFVHPDLA